MRELDKYMNARSLGQTRETGIIGVLMGQLRRRRGALTQLVLESGASGDRPFFLLDVGCSGGIDTRWSIFGDRLRADGFDPLVAEIERLNGANTHPGIRYHAAFVTCANYDAMFPAELRKDPVASRNNDPFARSSAAAAMQRMPTSYTQAVFNSGAPIVLAETTVVLDDWIAPGDRARIDFLKVDTDGHDIEVVLGAEGILAAGGVLGVSIEAQFHGPTHDHANTFSNIDRFLRSNGLTLFDLALRRYSRSALPAPFAENLTAQTTSGQLLWADALYFRDLGSLDYERMWGLEVTRERIMTLACLYDLFNLPDCAAELLVNRGAGLEPSLREQLLDSLVSGQPGSYAAHIRAFETDFTQFYPNRAGSTGEKGGDLNAKMKQLAKRNAELRERLRLREDRVEHLTKRVRELKEKREARDAGG